MGFGYRHCWCSTPLYPPSSPAHAFPGRWDSAPIQGFGFGVFGSAVREAAEDQTDSNASPSRKANKSRF